MTSRVRAQCSAESLSDVLRPFATSKKWLSYAEVPSAPMSKIMILAHGKLLKELWRNFQTWNLVRSVTVAAFRLIAEEKSEAWSLDAKHFKSWSKAMAARLRTMCRHASNARGKKSAWIESICDITGDQGSSAHVEEEGMPSPSDDAASEQDDAAEVSDGEDDTCGADADGGELTTDVVVHDMALSTGHQDAQFDDQIEWLVGFSWEHHEAWKVDARTPNATRDSTRQLISSGEDPTSAMQAIFADGVVLELPDLLYGQWQDLQATLSTSRAGAQQVLKGKRAHSGTHVTVAYRKERAGAEMFGLYENGRYVTGVLLKKFNGDSDAAKQLALELGRYMIMNNVSKEDVVRMRDSRYPITRKRPAAARPDAHKPAPAKPCAASTSCGTASSITHEKQETPRKTRPRKISKRSSNEDEFHDMSVCPAGMMDLYDLEMDDDTVSSTPRTPPTKHGFSSPRGHRV